MPAANELTSEGVTVTAEELDAVYDVMLRLTKIKSATMHTDWFVLMAARQIVSRELSIAKYGSVPGE